MPAAKEPAEPALSEVGQMPARYVGCYRSLGMNAGTALP